jgi:metal-dependent amidase/aminoacylase/carboxypeptidase family protein
MMEEVIRGATSAFGATYHFSYLHGYPATVNDPAFTTLAEAAAQSMLGAESVVRLARPRMPSEDFSYFLERVPGTFAMLGARPAGKEPAPTHSAVCDIDEAALAAGVMVHAAVAVRYLEG